VFCKCTIYEELNEKAEPIIKDMLTSENIRFYDVQSRVKSLISSKEKISIKHYHEPSEVHDLLGFRIICFVISDLKKISDILEDNLDTFENKDKAEGLGVNKLGYQSIHFVASLSN
jgi:putative GTP pyrophosphokinase